MLVHAVLQQLGALNAVAMDMYELAKSSRDVDADWHKKYGRETAPHPALKGGFPVPETRTNNCF
jgi:hypothetical protein